MSEALGLTELTDTKAPLLSEIFRLSKVSVLKSESPTPSEVFVIVPLSKSFHNFRHYCRSLMMATPLLSSAFTRTRRRCIQGQRPVMRTSRRGAVTSLMKTVTARPQRLSSKTPPWICLGNPQLRKS